ncbi:hypothetical protein [Candidatus Galacturonibacter soehngenii]|uniref:Uncharacterized protein n=1 Tax=Candidatus Galacturonatibacter soehngenii TaxID=2307010 RepID=A0A7V7QKI8_9FIRM|nr:hypothetical protein [Candidatus Galacturonibacter soehngenii]KAB1438028.1 hypothetical protein F7O84_10650 [Candidatus Galacturonibacter soehngenii]
MVERHLSTITFLQVSIREPTGYLSQRFELIFQYKTNDDLNLISENNKRCIVYFYHLGNNNNKTII